MVWVFLSLMADEARSRWRQYMVLELDYPLEDSPALFMSYRNFDAFSHVQFFRVFSKSIAYSSSLHFAITTQYHENQILI